MEYISRPMHEIYGRVCYILRNVMYIYRLNRRQKENAKFKILFQSIKQIYLLEFLTRVKS